MKIEMGESLFYSWLRHVKECQIVQTNWKISSQWNLLHEDELQKMMLNASEYFMTKHNYNIFKQNSSLSQIIQQGECDAVGLSVQNGVNQYYAVDVAFHGAGLNYGTSKDETIAKVISKSIRTAICLYGYFNTKKAEIIFASPKINPSIMNDLDICVDAVNALFKYWGFEFSLRIIANDEFNNSVLQPILLLSNGISDTNELFIRSYQMYTMFSDSPKEEMRERHSSSVNRMFTKSSISYEDDGVYKELRIGQLANVVLRKMLTEGCASEVEVKMMQESDYCKQTFDIQYPLLTKVDSDFEKVRYYVNPIVIYGEKYRLCSQWFETSANNDRPYLLKWIEKHKQ